MADLQPLYKALEPYQQKIQDTHKEMQTVIDDFVFEKWGLRKGQKVRANGQVGEIIGFLPIAQYMRCKIQVRENCVTDTTIDRVEILEEDNGQQSISS